MWCITSDHSSFLVKTIVLYLLLTTKASYSDTMPEVWEGKSYENYESHNFNEYMIELGVGFFTRQIGNALTPTVSLEKNGNIYKLTTSSTFKTQVLEFELGKEFDETTLDDRQVKSICTMEGNTLIQQQGGAKPGTITREFSATEMIATMKVGNVTCIRKYKAV